MDIESHAFCPTNDNGILAIQVFETKNHSYSIDSGLNFVNTSRFENLIAGDYFVLLKNEDTGCISDPYIVVINGETCFENCKNNIDDDGDGLIDKDDPDCDGGIAFENIVIGDVSLDKCPLQNDGTISISAKGPQLEYSIDNGLNYYNTCLLYTSPSPRD